MTRSKTTDAATTPRYPIYVPSKGRVTTCYTANFLIADGVPFYLVVEPQEHDVYTERYGAERVLVLPFSNPGSVIPARNWIKEHATAAGHLRHWQLDDNIKWIDRRWRARRLRCDSATAFRVVEDFTDRYENIALAGMNYTMFAPDGQTLKPFQVNCHVYSATLILNALPQKWRGRYNEDTDYCLQVLSAGWCTVLVNAFLVKKIKTMLVKGGNSADLYQGDGRLRMAQALERKWPGVVETKRRFKRPQHVIKDSWAAFDTPLRLKPGIDLSKIVPNEYGLRLTQVAEKIKSPRVRKLLAQATSG